MIISSIVKGIYMMKKITMLLAAALLFAATLPMLTSCESEEVAVEPPYVSVPFEDKGFESTVRLPR